MANRKQTNGMKKITEFKLDLNLKNIFLFLFIGFFIFFVMNSLSKELKQALPEKPISTIVSEMKEEIGRAHV